MPALIQERVERRNTFDFTIGTNLRVLREKRELTQEGLGEQIDLSQSQIKRIERGERAITLQQAMAAAKVLGVPLRRLTQEIPQ